MGRNYIYVQQCPWLRPDGMYRIELIEPSLTAFDSMIEPRILAVCLLLQILTLFSSAFYAGNYYQKRRDRRWLLWEWAEALLHVLRLLLALVALTLTGLISFSETIFRVASLFLQLTVAVDFLLDVGMPDERAGFNLSLE